MSRFHPSRFVWVLALTLGLSAVVAQAQEHRYHYVSLDQAPLPSGFTFFLPAAINDSGRVYGTACDATFNVCNIAFYADGAVTVLQAAGGAVGGFVVIDPQNFVAQAALFRKTRWSLFRRSPARSVALSSRLTIRAQPSSNQTTL
ncbi:MAG: hypothetical protein DMG09_27970 [Acidobacteria bacterium]|nr:MAG: hypothetical protein DMG09_27970 [Acidobacteriota bacterium]